MSAASAGTYFKISSGNSMAYTGGASWTASVTNIGYKAGASACTMSGNSGRAPVAGLTFRGNHGGAWHLAGCR